MKKDLTNFAIGVAACIVFAIIHNRIAFELGWTGGEFAFQGPMIFASGVLVALLLKNNRH
jgi:hypothetical protein